AAHQDRVGDAEALLVAEVEAVWVDRLVLPLARRAQLAPRPDILLRPAGDIAVPFEVRSPPPFAGGAKDPVELGEGELRDRVVLVDEDAERVAPPGDVVRAGGGDDLGDVVVVFALEGQALRPEDAAAGDPDVG